MMVPRPNARKLMQMLVLHLLVVRPKDAHSDRNVTNTACEWRILSVASLQGLWKNSYLPCQSWRLDIGM